MDTIEEEPVMAAEEASSIMPFTITDISWIYNESSDDMTTINPNSSENPALLPPERNLSLAYTVSEAVVSLLAIFGNALVVYIFFKNRCLRRYRNYYIVALAIADFFVGLLGIPFAILASVGLPRNLYGCLFTVSILIVLCTVSIFCLVAVSIDRYWATTNPFAYYRNMTTTTAVSIILFCWMAGIIIGFLPLFGWYNREGWLGYPSEYCFFTDVMDYSYLVFLYFATIVFPAILMTGFYGYIYHVVLIKIRQKGTFAPPHLRRFSEQSPGSFSCENRSAAQALRIMVSEKRREGKAAKKLGIIVLFFMLCWMPLYTINCIQAFFPNFQVPIGLLNFTIILSHANSALNPFLYAYHLKEFRLAMKIALISLFRKVFCGIINIEDEKENQLGIMSRSLTMPSLGHMATIPNQTGKVSIKFRKISRPTECKVKQMSPKMLASEDETFHKICNQTQQFDIPLSNLPASAASSYKEITRKSTMTAHINNEGDRSSENIQIVQEIYSSSSHDSIGEIHAKEYNDETGLILNGNLNGNGPIEIDMIDKDD